MIPEENDSLSEAASERQARTHGRDEMNLAEFPFAMLKRQKMDDDVFTHEGWVVDKNGNRQRQRWTVRGAGGLGLPTEHDERVVVALMALSAEQGFTDRKVPFSVYQVLKVMGINRSSRAYEAVQRSLERLVGVTIYAEGAFWDNGEKGWIKLKAGFHIIEKFWLAYLEEDEEVREAEGVPGYFVWSEDIWQSIQNGYIKYLDLDLYFGLTLPVARRLYRFLDKRMAYQREYEIDIFDLASRLGMARYEYPSEVIRKLQPGMDELIEKGFLARAEAVKVGRYTRMRFHRLTPRLPGGVGKEAAPAPVPAAKQDDTLPLTEALVALGFTRSLARKLIGQHGAESVQEKLQYLRWEQEVRGKRLRSPRGWLRRALEENYSAPPGYDPVWWEQAVPGNAAAEEVEEFDDSGEEGALEVEGALERDLWEAVLREMEGQVTRATFQNLFAQTTLVKVQGDVAVIAVPSAKAQDWLENRLQRPLAHALERHTGHTMRLLFVRLGKS